LLPRSCCLRPRSLMPLLHSGPFQRLFFSIHPFRVSCSTLSLVECLLMRFPLRRATPARRVIFLPRPTISLGQNFPEDFSFVPCHCCILGHLPAGGSQHLLGSTNSSGQFLRLSMSPCSLLPAPMPLLPSFDRFPYSIFLRDLPMFGVAFHFLWISLQIRSLHLF
jgi:hypothetical protein